MSEARPLLTWAWAGKPLEGESGDLCVVVPHRHGTLVAAIDGLGHGPEAAHAAREASQILQREVGEPVEQLVVRCHEGLRATRGVVMSVVWFSGVEGTLDWCGVGNVEGVLLRGRGNSSQEKASIVNRGGVVGYRLPPLKVTTVPVSRHDTLVLATDGLRSDFASNVDVTAEPQEVAETLLGRCGKGTDDALVLVARYLGGVA